MSCLLIFLNKKNADKRRVEITRCLIDAFVRLLNDERKTRLHHQSP